MKIFATLALIAFANAIHIHQGEDAEDDSASTQQDGAPPAILRSQFPSADMCDQLAALDRSGPVEGSTQEELAEGDWYCADVAPCWDDTPAGDD